MYFSEKYILSVLEQKEPLMSLQWFYFLTSFHTLYQLKVGTSTEIVKKGSLLPATLSF